MQEILEKQLILKGADGADCADLLSLYMWLKQKQKLVRMGLSDNAAEILKGQDEDTQQAIVELVTANNEIIANIKDLKAKGEDVSELEAKSNDLKTRMGQLSLNEETIAKIIGYDKNTTDDLININTQLKELRFNILQILPVALKDSSINPNEMSIQDIETLLDNVVVNNGLNDADFLG